VTECFIKQINWVGSIARSQRRSRKKAFERRNRFRTFNVAEETSTQKRLLFRPTIQVLSACPLNGYFSVAKLSSRINSLTLAEDSGVIFEQLIPIIDGSGIVGVALLHNIYSIYACIVICIHTYCIYVKEQYNIMKKYFSSLSSSQFCSKVITNAGGARIISLF